MKLLERKPVQQGLMALAAGTVLCASAWGLKKASNALFGSSEGSLKTLLPMFDSNDAKYLELLDLYEPDFLDILGRLHTFRRFDVSLFHNIVKSMALAAQFRVDSYMNRSATSSFQIRSKYQKIIEATRLFRAVLEIKISSALEDFDEIAVDINGKVEQACMDSIQDTFT
jgi:hypothetical protein